VKEEKENLIDKIKRTNLFRGFKSIWNWIDVIWKDRQWDYSFFLLILIRKLELMKKHIYSDDCCAYVGMEIDYENICKALDLAKRLYNDDYCLMYEDFKQCYEEKEKDLEELFKIIRDNLTAWWD